ncbi:hypothetical protein F5B17DRAFT_441174 [Nemania serpens]|nr:hypothetical protein F5B17DRAFT_441174 [Nemania serpens]
MKPYQFAATVSLFAHSAFGVNIQQHCPDGQICLTSFKQCDNQYEEVCSELSGSYSRTASGNPVQLPAVLGDTNYTISWVFGPRGHADIPVRIQWRMDTIVWETDTTESEYIFNPGEILASFPTTLAPNMTSEHAWFNASQYSKNVLIVSQPDAVLNMDNNNSLPMAISRQFTVQPNIIRDYVEAQIELARQTEYNKWRLGVGIGLGMGIPFLVAATTLGVLAMSKAQKRMQMNEDVYIVHGRHLLY